MRYCRMSQKYYSSKKLRKKKCDFYIIIGQKSNGKSFDIKSLLLNEALHDGRKFAYMRRWPYEKTANKVEQYFKDEALFTVNNLAPYTEVQAYAGEIFLGNRNDKGKKTRDYPIGYAVDLAGETHYSSLAFPDVYNILFEEFITDSGYLGDDEVTLFNKLVSTILRQRENTTVYMIGNTINRFCPYFSEFNININTIKKGEIVYYKYHDPETDRTIMIGIEYCDDIFENKKVFGKSAKMINGGEWLTSTVPLIKGVDLDACKEHFRFYVEKEHSTYCCKIMSTDKIVFMYVYPYTRKTEPKYPNNSRIITDKLEFYVNPLITNELTDNLICDTLIKEVLAGGKIVYSDSLTGTEFNIIMKERRWM